jgi:hypothetical protein
VALMYYKHIGSKIHLCYGLVIVQAVSPVFEPRSGHVGFVVGEVALGQVFSERIDFPCEFSFHQLLHIHACYHRLDTHIVGK